MLDIIKKNNLIRKKNKKIKSYAIVLNLIVIVLTKK